MCLFPGLLQRYWTGRNLLLGERLTNKRDVLPPCLCFSIHVHRVWIPLISHTYLSDQPGGFETISLMLDISVDVSTKFFHTCHAYRHIAFCFHLLLHSPARSLGSTAVGEVFVYTNYYVTVFFPAIEKVTFCLVEGAC